MKINSLVFLFNQNWKEKYYFPDFSETLVTWPLNSFLYTLGLYLDCGELVLTWNGKQPVVVKNRIRIIEKENSFFIKIKGENKVN